MDRVLWSLKPIASWLDVLGVDLQLAQNRRPILRRYSQQFLGLIVFSCFVGLRLQIFVTNEVDYVIVRDWKGVADARHFTQTASMARNLRHLTSALSPIFLHLSFLTAVAFRWTHLTDSIDAVIHLINPDNRFYRKLGRVSFAGLGCIFVVNLMFFTSHFKHIYLLSISTSSCFTVNLTALNSSVDLIRLSMFIYQILMQSCYDGCNWYRN